MRYLVANGPAPTTASFASVTTGTAIKTLLQVKPFIPARIVEWGFSVDGFVAALPGKVELIETDVAATVTAHVDGDISKFDQVGDGVAASVGGLTLGVSATGYTASAEGTITAVRLLDGPQFMAPTNQYQKQFPLGERPLIQVAKFARIRVLFGAAVNAYCYMILEI